MWFRLPFALSIPILVSIVVFLKGIIGLKQDSPELIWIAWAAVLLIIFSIVISIVLIIVKLETEVRSDGLYVRFSPFHTDYKKFTSDSISEYYICRYKPLREYGGRGIRFGKNGKAYNMSGNKGVQLVLKNGRRLLIGSQKPQELAEAINSFMANT